MSRTIFYSKTGLGRIADVIIFLSIALPYIHSQSKIFSASFDGSLSSSEMQAPVSAINLSFTSGIFGQGIEFPANGVLQYPILDNLNVKQGTMSVWVKPNWDPGTILYRIMVVGNDPRNFELHVDEGSNLAFAVNTSQVGGNPISLTLESVAAWTSGVWHQLVFTWDNNHIKMYVDGAQLGSAPVGFEIPDVADAEFHIGSYFGGEGFDGIIDEFAIYDSPLSSEQVWQMYKTSLNSISKPGDLMIVDDFGRAVSDRSLELVDWEGFIKNPAFKYYIHPPDSVDFPLSVSLSANHGNVYFSAPSTVSMVSGPAKNLIIESQVDMDSFYISFFPDRNFMDDSFDLSFRYFHMDGTPRIQSIPFVVLDEDVPEDLTYEVIVDFSEDTTSLIAQPNVREVIEEAARDWVYFVDGSAIDSIDVGDAQVWIGRTGNLVQSKPVTNKEKYRGLYMFIHGTNQPKAGGTDEHGDPLCICSTGYSGDESFQTSGGMELPLRSIGGHELNILGNFNENGYTIEKGAEDWTFENRIPETEDLYYLSKHEMGHIMYGAFTYPLHAEAVAKGYFSSPEITAYYPDGVVKLFAWSPDHFGEVIDPISLGNAYGGGGPYFPDMREVVTKIDLLIMQAIGYPMRPIRALAPLEASVNPIISGQVGESLSEFVEFSGSLPYYHISIIEGSLPDGMELDSFTGEIYGTPKKSGSFPLTIKIEEYAAVEKSIEVQTVLEILPKDCDADSLHNLSDPFDSSYRVKTSISLSGLLESPNSLSLFAGESIEFLPLTTIEKGAWLDALIEDCHGVDLIDGDEKK